MTCIYNESNCWLFNNSNWTDTINSALVAIFILSVFITLLANKTYCVKFIVFYEIIERYILIIVWQPVDIIWSICTPNNYPISWHISDSFAPFAHVVNKYDKIIMCISVLFWCLCMVQTGSLFLINFQCSTLLELIPSQFGYLWFKLVK